MTIFENKRADYTPYGLRCDVWHPTIMPRFDHHNEIEINYIPEGSLRYFFHNRIITVPAGSICIFWAFMSHRIMDYSELQSYYVVTIPTNDFLKWNLSKEFLNRIFSCEIIVENVNDAFWNVAEFERWVKDSNDIQFRECMSLELQSKLKRIDIECSRGLVKSEPLGEIPLNKTQEMILYILNNFTSSIHISDIADAVGLNPDYAGALFKKTIGMTLSEYVQKERIAHAQRELLFSDKSVTQIAYASGFNSISSFNIAFKAVTSLTPREYKRQLTIDN